MALTVGMITTDSTDPEPLATWWAQQTDAHVAEMNDGWFVIVQGGKLPIPLAFQKVEQPTPGKNRIHVDFVAHDLDAETDRLVAAGATLVARRGDEHFRWHTLADPQGNEFCISGHHGDSPSS